jgi:hypothetical protein
MNKDEGNQYWHNHYPYVSWTPFPEDDEFFSMGAVQPVADLQVALSSTLNQYLTNARKAANPMWIAGSKAAQTPDWMFVNRPDGVVRVVGDIDQIKQVRPIDTSDTSISMRRELNTTFEKTSSMSSLYTTGAASQGTPQINKTARGAQIINSEIDVNMQIIVSLFGAQGLKTIGDHFLELNSQFMTEEQEFKLTGEDNFRQIKPGEVSANFDVEVNPDTILKVNAVTRQAQLLNLKATIDGEQQVKIDKKPIWRAIFAAFPEMDNIGNVIIDPAQVAKEEIATIMNGSVPKVEADMDHKLIMIEIKKFLMGMEKYKIPYDDGTLDRFAEVLQEHMDYMEAAKNMNMAGQQNPVMQNPMMQALAGKMAQGGGGGMLPPMPPTPPMPGGSMEDQQNGPENGGLVPFNPGM